MRHSCLRMLAPASLAVLLIAQAGPTAVSAADDSQTVLTLDHFVAVPSEVPAIKGETVRLYVRERVLAGTLARSQNLGDKVALFVHGAGTPAEVAFDTPHADYSWMAYLARAGYDVFSVDLTGYGRSTRPAAMNDPCNLDAASQAEFVPGLLAAPCPPSYPFRMTTIASDWHDIGAAVDYIRALRRVERVHLLGWSMGGPRAGGYAARHPEKVNRVVLLAPAYNRTSAADPPAQVPAEGATMSKQSRADFVRNWDRQAPCAGQYEQAALESVWAEMLASDPVGATWGTGVRRAPLVTSWGWDRPTVAGTRTPMLLVAGIHDAQVPPARVLELYEDLGASEKVLIDLGCASHNAMWETNHGLLFDASLEWLESGTAEGQSSGVIRLGYGE